MGSSLDSSLDPRRISLLSFSSSDLGRSVRHHYRLRFPKQEVTGLVTSPPLLPSRKENNFPWFWFLHEPKCPSGSIGSGHCSWGPPSPGPLVRSDPRHTFRASSDHRHSDMTIFSRATTAKWRFMYATLGFRTFPDLARRVANFADLEPSASHYLHCR